MKDPRFTDLAKLLVRHSCDVQPGETVLVEATDIPAEFTVELMVRRFEALYERLAAGEGLPQSYEELNGP